MARAIKAGAIFAYPTDTIWGLGCHPLHPGAVHRILELKRRSISKGMILLSSSIEYAIKFIDPGFRVDRYPQLEEAQPRPTTWLLPATPGCPDWLTAGGDRIALRITQLPHIAELCTRLESPLVSTSANISGHTPIRNSIQAQRQFTDKVDFIVYGHTGGAQASRIIDIESGNVIRG
jgi:L-threonylcarbamoyladenylate synthase